MKIIVATDFSPSAQSATQAAAQLARKLGDTLLLVRVIEPPTVMYPELQPANLETITTALQEAAEAQMKEARASLVASEIPVEGRILYGVPEQVICAQAVAENARLVVMGTHGRHAVARVLLGSVAERTVLGASCPVLVVREGANPFAKWAGGDRPLRVLAGIDGSPATHAALGWLRQLRQGGPCDLVLTHHYWPPQEYARLGLRGPRDAFGTDPEVTNILERELRNQLGELAGMGQVVVRARAAWGRPGEALSEEAEADHADLLVVGTRQPHGWDRVRGGSAALSTLHASRISVLCIPERTGRDSGQGPLDVSVPVIRCVVAATDFSDLGNSTVLHACSLLRGGGGTVELIHVRERTLPIPIYAYESTVDALKPEEVAQMEARLHALIPKDCEPLGIKIHLNVVDGGSADEAIVQAANRLGADAICVGSHGRSGLAKAVLGSVAARVLERSNRPVFIVRHPRP